MKMDQFIGEKFYFKKGSSQKLIEYLNQNNFYARNYYPPLIIYFQYIKKNDKL